jgi:hypothetical protein
VNHIAGFDRYAIGECNGRIRGEVQTLRLERRLLEDGGPRAGSRLLAVVSKSALPLLRRTGLAG